MHSKPIITKQTADHNGRLVVITGHAGSGKTTIGKVLAKDLNYAFLDNNTDEYKSTFKSAYQMIKNGVNVIIAIPFIEYMKDYEKWQDLKVDMGFADNITEKFIWLKYDIDREKHMLSNWNEVPKTAKDIVPDKRYQAYIYDNKWEISTEGIPYEDVMNGYKALKRMESWIKK